MDEDVHCALSLLLSDHLHLHVHTETQAQSWCQQQAAAVACAVAGGSSAGGRGEALIAVRQQEDGEEVRERTRNVTVSSCFSAEKSGEARGEREEAEK